MNRRKRPRKRFRPSDRRRCLLWCARHCCICGKNCGLDIELDHLDARARAPALNKIDNALPVCYDCHASLERSRRGGPRGSKYSDEELKQRRDQVYDEHTRHLVPVIGYGPVNDANVEFPAVRFRIENKDGSLQVKVRCVVEIWVGGKFFGTPIKHYGGKRDWACNPGLTILGWFNLSTTSHLRRRSAYRGPAPHRAIGRDLRLRVRVTISWIQ